MQAGNGRYARSAWQLGCAVLLLAVLPHAGAAADDGPRPAFVARAAPHLLGLDADGVRHPARDGLVLPRSVHRLRIDYAADGDPQTFRYRLEGLERDWQDAGSRTEAFYTDLPPGAYRFVVAGARDGGAALRFSVAPAFTQTWWFRALCGLLAFVLLWLLYLLRLRQMTLRLRVRLEERYGERERIARELHDTLLQGIQGLLLRFQAVAERIADADTRRMLETTLDRAEAVLVEGRDRVRELRDLARPIERLDEAFVEVGREFKDKPCPQLRVMALLKPRRLNPLVRDELYRIGREAIINAIQHARAHHIDVEIEYGREEFALRVRDDGVGLPAEVLAAGARAGHWGLPGMRERAARLGARFELWSQPGLGVAIDVRVPADVVYCDGIAASRVRKLLGKAVAEDVMP